MYSDIRKQLILQAQPIVEQMIRTDCTPDEGKVLIYRMIPMRWTKGRLNPFVKISFHRNENNDILIGWTLAMRRTQFTNRDYGFFNLRTSKAGLEGWQLSTLAHFIHDAYINLTNSKALQRKRKLT